VFILKIDLTSSHLSRFSSQISDDQTSTEALQEGESTRDPSGKIMAPWIFSIKFPRDTQFIFGSLMFTAGEEENLELLTQGVALNHPALVYGKAPYYPIDPSTSGEACSHLNPYAGPYYLASMTS
jgi:hypothetical protein